MIDKDIKVMENELESIKQNGKCRCNCEKCNLTYKCDELIETYERVIGLLREKKKIEEEEKEKEREELRRFSNRLADGLRRGGRWDDMLI